MRLVIVSSSNDLKYVKNIKGKKYIVSGYTAVSNYFKKNNYFCNDLNTRILDLKKKITISYYWNTIKYLKKKVKAILYSGKNILKIMLGFFFSQKF